MENLELSKNLLEPVDSWVEVGKIWSSRGPVLLIYPPSGAKSCDVCALTVHSIKRALAAAGRAR